MNKTKAEYRHHRKRVIARKKEFIKKSGFWHYKFEGQLGKGKIHCSCRMCSGKTKYRGASLADRRKIDRCELMIKEAV